MIKIKPSFPIIIDLLNVFLIYFTECLQIWLQITIPSELDALITQSKEDEQEKEAPILNGS